MSGSIRIKVADLTPKFIEGFKAKYADKDLEIRVTESTVSEPLSEELFWQIIGLLDWSDSENSETVLASAIKKLAEQPTRFIYQFQDLLSKKLFELDAKKFAENIGEDAWTEGKYFSVDNFLYARCCVVANGLEAYQAVTADPKSMPKNLTFEPLLSLADKAFELKTGKAFNYFPTFNYETYSNESGWE